MTDSADASARKVLRIANCSGFYGDRLSAAREMVDGGPIDVLTGDYLAELTMLVLWKSRQRDSRLGYATSFVRQMEDVLGTCLERGVKIVSNAGGLNPAGLAAKLQEVASALGLRPKIAYLRGDDIMGILDQVEDKEGLQHLETGASLAGTGIEPVTANAYLGAWGIVEALRREADVVICPRVTDASLVVGPAAWAFGWQIDDWDRLAGAVAIGHILECGPQATGGNFAFFQELRAPVHPGFPIAEVEEDGSGVITKHPGTGGAVTIDTVTAQLVYEIAEPEYANADCVARFDTICLVEDGPDRVRVSATQGLPAPESLKVCINYIGGWRNSVTFMLTGLEIHEKAAFVEAGLWDALGGKDAYDATSVQLVRSDSFDATRNSEAVARLTITVKDRDSERVGRRFFDAATGLGLSSYPGTFSERANRQPSEYGVYWPATISREWVHPEVVMGEEVIGVPSWLGSDKRAPVAPFRTTSVGGGNKPGGPTRSLPLGSLFGARSGDKGGNANVGLWARTDEAYCWLRSFLSVDQFRLLLPEADALVVRRYELPTIRALNFVVEGLLEEGVAASSRLDPQAKGLGEYIRSRVVDLPTELLKPQ